MLVLAVCGSMKTAARTTTVPRSKGPALAGTAITKLSGAPRYGPARKIGPCSRKKGVGPTPMPIELEPTRLAGGQSGSPVCSTPPPGWER
jgi:hypothetical protein